MELFQNAHPDRSLPSHRLIEILTEDEILARVKEIGKQITHDFSNVTEPLMLVGILKGATIFIADLIRSIEIPVEFDFVAVSSYGAATVSSGEVRVLKDLDVSVSGKHIIVVEDILDTGMTLRSSFLMETLRARHAASVRFCTLLDKPSRRKVHIDVDYCGFQIDDHFVVGYGMDYGEQYRNLRSIFIVSFAADAPDDS